jgi:hypothetical protein
VAQGAGGYQIDSFFDIFTEVSTDGGMSWMPTVAGPATVTLQPMPSVVLLSIKWVSGGRVQLQWPQGTLLETTNLLSPWKTNFAPWPYTVTPTNAQKFYRVQVQ